MKIKCDYCGSTIEEKNAACPNCGAALSGANRFAGEQPKTIEELQRWYEARELPPEEVTRFFIGKNITEPRAFGIYKDGSGDFIVYKNKADGTRAIRYQGADEAYAVNELYQKLKSEIADRKSRSGEKRYQEAATRETRQRKSKVSSRMAGIYAICILIPALSAVVLANKNDGPSRGYYRYENETYYCQSSSWYYYDDEADDWSALNEEEVPEEVYSDEDGEYLTYSHEGKSFEDSIWYVEDSYDDYDSDWDSDYNWDSGSSWDSGGTDWSSDW